MTRLERGTLLVAGAAGTGKSHLARYLLAQLDRSLDRVALVDADPGQTTVGVPACLGLALTRPWQAPAAAWFIGDVTPRRAALPSVVGAAVLARRARRSGAQAVVVDSCGLVGGPHGVTLQVHLALAAEVDQVVALERDRELSPLLAALGARGLRIHRLRPVREAVDRSPEARRRYREGRFAAHFHGARVRRFGFSKLMAADLHGPVQRSDLGVGRVVGLLDGEGFCLALGLVTGLGSDHLAVATPWAEPGCVQRLQLGQLVLDPRRIAPEALAD
jgi:polynucleotide 5'-hydroxyl-kinase GRC3/NOL9